MKKLLSLVLALCLMFTLAVPAMAVNASMDNFQPVKAYNGFSDIASGHWAESSVKTCYEYDLMRGNSETTFNLSGDLTIAEALVMATKVHEIYSKGEAVVTPGEIPWYQPFVDYCLEQNIIQDGEFADYSLPATRAQMAGIFARALPASQFTSTSPYSPPDVNTSTPYYSEILTLYASGILSGSDLYGTFKPNDNISRAEAAVIISRIAIRDLREVKVLMKDVIITQGVVAAVPQDVLDITDDVGMPALGSETALVLTYGESDPVFLGYDITLIPAEDYDAVMQDSFGLEMMGLNTIPVVFGNLKAYRSTFSSLVEGVEMNFAAYSYIHGSTLQMVFLGSTDSDELTLMANNLRLDGVTAKPGL